MLACVAFFLAFHVRKSFSYMLNIILYFFSEDSGGTHLPKEKGWFPRHCAVRADEEESSYKKEN